MPEFSIVLAKVSFFKQNDKIISTSQKDFFLEAVKTTGKCLDNYVHICIIYKNIHSVFFQYTFK